METVIPIVAVCLVLALARVIKNLPRDSITKFFEHRTTKYQIIADDAKGRIAAVQKQRLVFLGFVVACVAVIGLVLINSTSDEARAPAPGGVPTTVESPPSPGGAAR
ncbi:hypothetical protein OHT76_23630 [Streptomyces sp. NBC_00287]|uniref:hypothetical protein n=1 Tax=Streptomyces sp. NBC_00287 TaxID=2975702 RepID=UPI002E2CCC77|nr:hypothetical protein [Streptomyces sp. NBC_00287]